jgi:hypothetical protein
MTQPEYELAMYGASAYVWCKGSLSGIDRHPIFVSSPVKFLRDEGGRYILLACPDQACSLCGHATRYEESELGFQDDYVPLEKALPKRPQLSIAR